MAQKQIPAETKNDKPGHNQHVRKAAGADKYGRRPIHDDARNRRHSIRLAQQADILRDHFRIQESRSNDRLGDSEAHDDQHESKIHIEKAPKFGLGIDQRVAHQHQRHVTEIKLYPKNAVKDAGRGRIEDLHDAEPEQHQQSSSERWTKTLYVFIFTPIGDEEGKVDHDGEQVFCEVDRHVVAEEFAGEVFEQQPCEEEIQAVTPIVEHRDDKSAANEDHADERDGLKVT